MKGNAKGCEVFDKRLPATELPTILLVERGGARRGLPAGTLTLRVPRAALVCLGELCADVCCVGGAPSRRQTATSSRR